MVDIAPTRIAIITGAAQGIGEAIALRLADDGIDVVVNDLAVKKDKLDSVAKAIQAKGRRSLAVLGDATVEADVVSLVEHAVEAFGGLDIMIANAGTIQRVPIVDTTVEDWDRVINVNLRSVMLAYKYAARQMIKQGRGGRIIGAASMAGKKGFAYFPSYCASKFAVRGLTQSVALELAEHNITVNSYAPGIIPTGLTERAEDEKNGGQCSTFLLAAGLPLNVPIGTTAIIAELVAYLVKPEAQFMTGQCLSIDGGVVMD
ncbi:short chain oxidoreductase [Dichomitus squalens]|uniref:Short chain oxidoreductase n=1 Tax=Dichomitus squalens TaxID=114155 RepID=A0A4Q9MPD9_9APHY|nr:short chain oxidoreductase [Dichomitus squalens]